MDDRVIVRDSAATLGLDPRNGKTPGVESTNCKRWSYSVSRTQVCGSWVDEDDREAGISEDSIRRVRLARS
jgi:hypothetical protein